MQPGASKNPVGLPRRGFVKLPAMTYSRVQRHYHGPWMLNGRVRNGNGCDHPGKLTGKLRVIRWWTRVAERPDTGTKSEKRNNAVKRSAVSTG